MEDTVSTLLEEHELIMASKQQLETENRRLKDELDSHTELYQDCVSNLEAAEAQIQEQTNDIRSLQAAKVSLEEENTQLFKELASCEALALHLEDSHEESLSNTLAVACLVLSESRQEGELPIFPQTSQGATASAPRGDVETVKQAISCPICFETLKEAVAGSCCQGILGCRTCVTRSMETNGPLCPLCRSDNPHLIAVRGLDDLFSALARIFPSD